jgi:hypothetical protein
LGCLLVGGSGRRRWRFGDGGGDVSVARRAFLGRLRRLDGARGVGGLSLEGRHVGRASRWKGVWWGTACPALQCLLVGYVRVWYRGWGPCGAVLYWEGRVGLVFLGSRVRGGCLAGVEGGAACCGVGMGSRWRVRMVRNCVLCIACFKFICLHLL